MVNEYISLFWHVGTVLDMHYFPWNASIRKMDFQYVYMTDAHMAHC